MRVWKGKAANAAPIGAASFLVLAAVAVCCVGFGLFTRLPAGFMGRWVAAFLLIVAYFLFPPAVACSVYSALFETSKALGLAGLALATLIGALAWLTFAYLLDGLLLVPCWFLAVLGVIKFVTWRKSRRMHPTQAGSC